MDISRLSSHYKIRVLTVSDVGIILDLCQQNTFFYEYTEAQPTSEQILDDMKQTPPGIDMSAKYYVGFFEGQDLACSLICAPLFRHAELEQNVPSQAVRVGHLSHLVSYSRNVIEDCMR